MKLVLVNYEYSPLGGGAGNATACIARALALPRQWHDELVRHGETGLLFDVNDASALGAAMIALAEAQRLRQQVGECARDIARKQYSWNVTAAQYAALFG